MPEKTAGDSEAAPARGQTICLSWPPSQNALWRAFRGRTILSKQGRLWYEQAAKELLAQGAAKMVGPVIINVELAAPTRRSYDPDNKIKALFDSLVKSAIIEDDSNLIIKHYTVSVDGAGFQGARITLRCLDAQTQSNSQESHS